MATIPPPDDVKLVIPAVLAQQIMDYLLTCPCGQVMDMVTGMRKLPRAVIKDETSPPPAMPSIAQSVATEGV